MNVRVHSLAASSQCELDSAWSHRHPWHVQKLTSLSIFEREFLLTQKRRYCIEPPPSVASSKIDLHVNFWTRVFAHAKTSLLRGTTAIHGGTRWNRTGKMCCEVQYSFEKRRNCDNRTGCPWFHAVASLFHKLAVKKCTGRTFFNDAARKIFMGLFYVLGSAPLYIVFV